MHRLFQIGLAVGCFGLLTSSVFAGMVVAGVLRFRRTRAARPRRNFLPPVSLLKPLHGSEPGLEAHLATFFEQDYPQFEILFCARQLTDPGLECARRVAACFPKVPVQFLASGEPTVPNAKLLSLDLMARQAHFDILIISDSDVHVAADYLKEVVAPFEAAGVGAVTCLYRGDASQGGFWSRMEAAAMSVEMTAGVLVADMLEGMKFALGPTMAIRRDSLKCIGGFLPMGDYCSDDFLLGNRVAARGETVVLSHHIIDHVVLQESFLDSMRHQARWMKSTRFSRPKGHFGTALTFSVPFGVLAGAMALLLQLPALAAALFGWSILTRMAMAAGISRVVLRERSPWQSILLYPLRDLFGIGFWAASYWSRRIYWRNEIYLLEKEGRMRRQGA